MDLGRKELRALLPFFFTVLITGAVNAYGTLRAYVLPTDVICAVGLNTIYINWIFSVRRRFPQKQMRYWQTLFAVMMITLSLLRTAKYAFTQQDSVLQRYLWYGYYIPNILGPLSMFFASLHLGRPDDFKSSKYWHLLWVPSALLIAGIMTNDLHQLAFRFLPGFAEWSSHYTHGPLYYATAVWMAALALGTIYRVVRTTVSLRIVKNLWLPAAVLAIAALYRVRYNFGGTEMAPLQLMFEYPDLVCLGSLAFWESLVCARILTSNSRYPAFFASSSLNAGLAEHDFTVRQVSAGGISPGPEELKKAENGELLLPDKKTLLKAMPVKGGRFYWTEDISDILAMNAQLAETADYLDEENAMMRLSAEMDESLRVTLQKTRLYDSVTLSIRPQLEKLAEEVRNMPGLDEDGYREALRRAIVLLTYCKRRSDLLLRSDIDPVLTGDDIGLSFLESKKALALSGIPCEINSDRLTSVSCRDTADLYEVFERALEAAPGSLKSAAVELYRGEDGSPAMRMTINVGTESTAEDAAGELRQELSAASIAADGGRVTVVTSAGSKKSGGVRTV